ncbi:hypothetical protein ACQ4LE_009339 [Meloidogyne hapla]
MSKFLFSSPKKQIFYFCLFNLILLNVANGWTFSMPHHRLFGSAAGPGIQFGRKFFVDAKFNEDALSPPTLIWPINEEDLEETEEDAQKISKKAYNFNVRPRSIPFWRIGAPWQRFNFGNQKKL